MVEYRGHTRAGRGAEKVQNGGGREWLLGLKNAFFILFCYPMRPSIYSTTLPCLPSRGPSFKRSKALCVLCTSGTEYIQTGATSDGFHELALFKNMQNQPMIGP